MNISVSVRNQNIDSFVKIYFSSFVVFCLDLDREKIPTAPYILVFFPWGPPTPYDLAILPYSRVKSLRVATLPDVHGEHNLVFGF